MNYTQDGVYSLDLQSVAKRIYFSLIYRSTFYKFLNEKYIGEIRNTGTPMIEVLKSGAASVNVRETKEITSALTPGLLGYSSVKVDLTDLLDYPAFQELRDPEQFIQFGLDNTIFWANGADIAPEYLWEHGITA